MANVFDVAAYIVERMPGITTMKLQKLVYYSQAWSLVWDEKPLFDNRIEAWANGPVSPDLYHAHKGEFTIVSVPRGNANALTEDERETIHSVLDAYGDKTAPWLSALTHQEAPWLEAREGLAEGERSNRVIEHAAMANFYGNL